MPACLWLALRGDAAVSNLSSTPEPSGAAAMAAAGRDHAPGGEAAERGSAARPTPAPSGGLSPTQHSSRGLASAGLPWAGPGEYDKNQDVKHRGTGPHASSSQFLSGCASEILAVSPLPDLLGKLLRPRDGTGRYSTRSDSGQKGWQIEAVGAGRAGRALGAIGGRGPA